MEFSYLLNYFISLLVICNPATAVPVLLSLTPGKTGEERRKIGLAAGVAVGVILLVVTWIGGAILDVLSIRVASFQVTGGLVLLLLALSMLNAKVSGMQQTSEDQKEAKTKESIIVVPLAIPLMAGPGAISTVIVSSQLHPLLTDKLLLSCAALAVALVTATMLFFASQIERVLGQTGLNIATRLGGLVLAALAIETMAKGISGLFFC